MTLDGASHSPAFTPARFIVAVAAAALAGNVYLLLGDALAPEQVASKRSTTPSSVEAARGQLPGEISVHPDPTRWKGQ